MLRQGHGGDQALERFEIYTLRIEQYVEAMSSIQRLEQMPVCPKSVNIALLRGELTETAKLLAPSLNVSVMVPDAADIALDHGIFLTVAENLIGNAARFAREKLEIQISLADGRLRLSVSDDGEGFPDELLRNGVRPFGRKDEDAVHFGMGLYGSQMLCVKHGGELLLENRAEGGAVATAVFGLAVSRAGAEYSKEKA